MDSDGAGIWVKILQTVPFFPPAFGFGGLSEAAYQISKSLVNIGHEVVVYTSDAYDLKTRLDVDPIEKLDGIEVHYLRNLPFRPIKNLFVTPNLIQRVKKTIRDFDVIHLHGHWSYQNIVVQHYATKYGIPYVFQAHGSLPRESTHLSMKRIFDLLFGDRILRNTSKVIAVSQMEVEQYIAKHIPKEKIECIPNGIDLFSFVANKGIFRERHSIPTNDIVLLFLGRLHPLKGVDILVRAFAHLVCEYDNIRLVIAGPDDGHLPSLIQLVHSLELTNKVVFAGPLYETKKYEVYRDSDVFILPSRYEIFGIVILEACAFSLPIIASNLPSLATLVNHGTTGFLFKTGNVESLADMIRKILRSKENMKSMGLNGRHFIEDQYSIEEVAKKIELVYEEVKS